MSAHRQYRAVFISDVHLGTKDCQAKKLLKVLREIECETIYLVGDILDIWSLRRKWYWPKTHNEIVRRLVKDDENLPNVIFVPGNHDELFRDYDGYEFGKVTIRNEVVHTTLEGRKILVVHGDEFDAVVTNAKLITKVGDWLYYLLLYINRKFNRLRRAMRMPYWSLSAFVKKHVKSVISFVANFEKFLVKDARKRGVDGVICGHIHYPQIRNIDGIVYLNCGDWVENCTAIVETLEGKLELVDFSETDVDDERHSSRRTASADPHWEAESLADFPALVGSGSGRDGG
ncbi:MAG: UDP-2,3-diacylglucosamine diphosphatase [Planctomycetes bacterium]|nr:UDP-2,3-diacylglucosamine diphosphatase [Planctomycetota bacterium]